MLNYRFVQKQTNSFLIDLSLIYDKYHALHRLVHKATTFENEGTHSNYLNTALALQTRTFLSECCVSRLILALSQYNYH